MFVDCTLHPEHCAQYRVFDASTGAEVTDCVAACEEEGWVLTVHPDQRYSCRMSGPACRLEFRPVRIEPVARKLQDVKYRVGDAVWIQSTAAALSAYTGHPGEIEHVIRDRRNTVCAYEVRTVSLHRVCHVRCRPDDLVPAVATAEGGHDVLDSGTVPAAGITSVADVGIAGNSVIWVDEDDEIPGVTLFERTRARSG